MVAIAYALMLLNLFWDHQSIGDDSLKRSLKTPVQWQYIFFIGQHDGRLLFVRKVLLWEL